MAAAPFAMLAQVMALFSSSDQFPEAALTSVETTGLHVPTKRGSNRHVHLPTTDRERRRPADARSS